ncbi:hypothetical protein [Adlercreutzia sp. ZJ473]|uniref:hypothetical protein n=1 Tax=Adlercreutzia sp. ZJ473 TaxID=2722822 RepID=UPI0015549319|nr:hypothetical protein [Adlercreutzia sp. ZJ473]
MLKATYALRTSSDLRDSDLVSFGLITDAGTLTNAGALMADEPLLRHSRVFCTRWGGKFKDEFVDTAEYEGGLLLLLRERSESTDLAPGAARPHAHSARSQILRLRALRALRSGWHQAKLVSFNSF